VCSPRKKDPRAVQSPTRKPLQVLLPIFNSFPSTMVLTFEYVLLLLLKELGFHQEEGHRQRMNVNGVGLILTS
jgi:hypothetical protein